MIKKQKKAKLILDYVDIKDNYSEGDIENQILKILKEPNSKEKIEKLLSNNPSWSILYHFSPIRENLLDWFPFKKDANLLEVGSGCGALTGLFCNKLKKVTAVELTKRRAMITALRHKEKKNLTVIAGNLNKIKLKEKFDYVTLIGVLEYAGKYTESENPFLDFILKIKSYLKENGTVIIAIENKFGLKYWAGAKDDHTGKAFDSLENYLETEEAKTFGKKELKDLLEKANFTKVDFYYPLPDYKLPTDIFSDKYLPKSHNIRIGLYPYRDFSHERCYLFNERAVVDNIILNDNFGFFANSFLIIAKNKN